MTDPKPTLAALAEMEKLATAGPWTISALAPGYIVGPPRDEITKSFEVVCSLAEYGPNGEIEHIFRNGDVNRAFIAAARNAFPALIAVARAAEEWRIKRLVLEQLRNEWRTVSADALYGAETDVRRERESLDAALRAIRVEVPDA